MKEVIDLQRSDDELISQIKMAEGGTAIVICNSRRSIKYVTSLIHSNKIDVISLDPRPSLSYADVQMFIEGRVDVLVTHANTIMTGAAFTNTSTMIYWDVINDQSSFMQLNARVDRIGQKNKVKIVRLHSH